MATRKTSKKAKAKKAGKKDSGKQAMKRRTAVKKAKARKPASTKKVPKKSAAKKPTIKAIPVKMNKRTGQLRLVRKITANAVVIPSDLDVNNAIDQALAKQSHPSDGNKSMSSDYHYSHGDIVIFLKYVQTFLAAANPLFRLNWGPDLEDAAMTSLVGSLTDLILDKGHWT